MSMINMTAYQRGIAQHMALQVRDEIGFLGFSTTDIDRTCSAEQAEYAFKRLAETLGYRVEPIEPEASTVVNFRGEVPALRSAVRPGFDAKTGVPA